MSWMALNLSASNPFELRALRKSEKISQPINSWHAICSIFSVMAYQPKKNRNIKAMPHLKRVIYVVLFALIGTIFVANASATISLIKPPDVSYQIEESSISQIPVNTSDNSKSRAPEPTTLALFGSGFLGMIVRFVRKSYATAKRVFDIIAAVIGLIIVSPLCLMAALFIKLVSRGPVFFTQTRVGKDGELFEIYKFRTMRVNAEKETGPVWARANDNRLIFGGSVIRKAHIDEIPQFINVLKGEMSLIGPRPERPVFVEKFKAVIPDYKKRISVKPGITGLAQVWHKYDESIEDVKKKVKYDLLYIKKICLWTDMRILFRTFRVVVTGEGAR